MSGAASPWWSEASGGRSGVRDVIAAVRRVVNHPLNRGHRGRALLRYLRWQVGTRLLPGPVVVPCTDSARLLVARGMRGATGTVYWGLQEFEEMAFALHFLRPEDLFVDVGANVGAYTVVAAAVAGAHVVALEPVPSTFADLEQNVALNGLDDRVELHNVGAGRARSVERFLVAAGPLNRVLAEHETGLEAAELTVESLDDLLDGRSPALLKIDTEGYESEVVAGATRTLGSAEVRAVIMEQNLSGGRYGFDEAALRSLMIDGGFIACEYRPFERRLVPAGDRLGNVIFVRDPVAVGELLAAAAPFRVLGRSV